VVSIYDIPTRFLCTRPIVVNPKEIQDQASRLERQNLQAAQAAVQAAHQEAIMADAQAIANALTAVLQPMVAAITTTTAAAVAPAAQPVPAAPGQPGPVTFTHTPAQAQADLLNYKLPGNAKIYANAMAKLSTIFSLNKPNVSILLAELGDHANSMSWMTTLHISISTVPAAAGVAAIPMCKWTCFKIMVACCSPNFGSL
jgi:hypothetical protein